MKYTVSRGKRWGFNVNVATRLSDVINDSCASVLNISKLICTRNRAQLLRPGGSGPYVADWATHRNPVVQKWNTPPIFPRPNTQLLLAGLCKNIICISTYLQNWPQHAIFGNGGWSRTGNTHKYRPLSLLQPTKQYQPCSNNFSGNIFWSSSCVPPSSDTSIDDPEEARNGFRLRALSLKCLAISRGCPLSTLENV